MPWTRGWVTKIKAQGTKNTCCDEGSTEVGLGCSGGRQEELVVPHSMWAGRIHAGRGLPQGLTQQHEVRVRDRKWVRRQGAVRCSVWGPIPPSTTCVILTCASASVCPLWNGMVTLLLPQSYCEDWMRKSQPQTNSSLKNQVQVPPIHSGVGFCLFVP